MSNVNLIPNQALRNFIGNQVFGSPVIAKHATTHANIALGQAFPFRVNGQNYSKAAVATLALTAQPAQSTLLSTCYYLILIDTAGTVTCLKGTDNSDVLPEVPAGTLMIAVLKVALANAATFTSGTTALNATDVTTTVAHPAYMPQGRLATELTFTAT